MSEKYLRGDRFFMDHGLWHDRVTGQHLYTQDQYDELRREAFDEGYSSRNDEIASQSGQRAGVAVAKGEIWHVRLKGAGALTTLELLEVTNATILAKRPGDYYETRYSRSDVDFVERAAAPTQQEGSHD